MHCLIRKSNNAKLSPIKPPPSHPPKIKPTKKPFGKMSAQGFIIRILQYICS